MLAADLQQLVTLALYGRLMNRPCKIFEKYSAFAETTQVTCRALVLGAARVDQANAVGDDPIAVVALVVRNTEIATILELSATRPGNLANSTVNGRRTCRLLLKLGQRQAG